MWSCGWLRFSKSDEKKKAGDVSLHQIKADKCSITNVQVNLSVFSHLSTLSPGNLSWCTENAAKDGEGEEINPKCTPSIKAAVPILYSFSAVSCSIHAKSFITCLHGPLTGFFSIRTLV